MATRIAADKQESKPLPVPEATRKRQARPDELRR